MNKKMLFESPFKNTHDQGLFGVFDDTEVVTVIRLIDCINKNALAA